MKRQNQLALAAISFVLLVAAWTAITSNKVESQEPKKLEGSGRFQMSAWAMSSNAGVHGAYVIDTQTGKVWSIINEHEPKLIGEAK